MQRKGYKHFSDCAFDPRTQQPIICLGATAISPHARRCLYLSSRRWSRRVRWQENSVEDERATA